MQGFVYEWGLGEIMYLFFYELWSAQMFAPLAITRVNWDGSFGDQKWLDRYGGRSPGEYFGLSHGKFVGSDSNLNCTALCQDGQQIERLSAR